MTSDWYYSEGGQQKGPVSFPALQDLARSGRLDSLRDLAWTEGMPAWVPAGQVPGLFAQAAAGGAGDAFNPYAPPLTESDNLLARSGGEGELQEIPPGSQPLDAVECLKRGFTLTNRNFGPLLLIGLVYVVVSAVAEYLIGGIDRAIFGKPAPIVLGSGIDGIPVPRDMSVFGTILSGVVGTFLSLGITRVGLNFVSGDTAHVGQLFGQGRRLLRALGVSILFYLLGGGIAVIAFLPLIFGAGGEGMLVVGALCMGILAIYAFCRFGFYLSAIVDRDLGVFDSLRYSSALTRGSRLSIFGLSLLCILVVLGGALALFVGLIYALPVVFLTFPVAYRWLQYGRLAVQDHPGTMTPVLQGRTNTAD